nr:hypothetical protein 9 [Desulfobacterales bacterium]
MNYFHQGTNVWFELVNQMNEASLRRVVSDKSIPKEYRDAAKYELGRRMSISKCIMGNCAHSDKGDCCV